MTRFLKRLLVLFLLVAGLLFLFQKLNFIPSFKEWFVKKPLVIDNTPIVITQVRNIAELQAVRMYSEIVADSTVPTKLGIANQALRNIGIPTLPFSESKTLVLIVKGHVVAGLDLKKLTADHVFVKEDSVSIQLPPVEILDVITNPSDIETFSETGSWSDDEVLSIKRSARRKLLQQAAAENLQAKAAERSKVAIEQYLRLTGFTKIHVE